MVDKVGTKTDKTTQAGRDVYITPEGESVSEKSVTLKVGDEYVNVPSIHDGIMYSEDAIYDMLVEGSIFINISLFAGNEGSAITISSCSCLRQLLMVAQYS